MGGVCQQNLFAKDPIEAVAPQRYFVSEYGFLPDEVAMMKEIYARGPISCCMACPDDFEATYKGGVYVTSNDRIVCDHIVALVGFGGHGDGAYWVAQNSFGSVWGEKGFFRIKRSSALKAGEYNLGIEETCSWSMPQLPNSSAFSADVNSSVYV